MKEWIKSNLWEIKRSSSLQFLGTLLALANVLTYFYWQGYTNVITSKNHIPLVCWDFWSQCQTELIGSSAITFSLGALVATSVLAAILFNFQAFVGGAWILLLFGLISKSFLYFVDKSLSADIHVLLFFLNFIFLFVPSKSLATRVFVVAFYIATAFFKLNTTWLSGYPLLETIQFDNYKGLEWIAVFSMLIESALPWFLLSKNWQYFFIGFLSLLTYNLFYLYFDSILTPSVHIGLLVFFLFAIIEIKNNERRSLYQSFIRPEPTKAVIPAILALFIGFQFMPTLSPSFKSHPLKISKAKAPQVCDHYIIVKKNDVSTFKINRVDDAGLVKCHKQSFKIKALELCDSNEQVDSIKSIFFSANLLSTMFETFVEPLSCNNSQQQVK